MIDRSGVDRVLATNRYLVLGTADEHGRPWVSPVFFAVLDPNWVCWVSGPNSRHSRNIAHRPAIAITVFDSTVEVSAAEAAYFDADAAPATPDETDPALRALNARLPPHKQINSADLQPRGPMVVYRADLRRGGTGTWGQLTVFREAKRPYVSSAEVQFVSSMAGLIADGLRRGLMLGAAQAGDDDAGLLVLDADDRVSMANRAADRWLDELGTGDMAGTALPLVIHAVARQARALCDPTTSAAAAPADGRPARARARTQSGQWLIVRGSLLGDGPESSVAVMREAARPAEMAPSWSMPTASLTASAGSPSWWRKACRPGRSPVACTCRLTPCRTN